MKGTALHRSGRTSVATLLVTCLAAACSSGGSGDDGSIGNAQANTGGSAGSTGASAGQGGTAPGGVGSGTAGATAGGGPGTSAQGGAAGEATTQGGSAGTGGVAQGGAAGEAAQGGTGGDPDAAGDTPPWRELNVLIGQDQVTHGNAGLDGRAAKLLGKLVIELGVDSGGYVPWLGKRGFHVIGLSFFHCNISNDLGRDHNGDCRLNTFDGMPHGDQNNVGPADCVSAKVRDQLTSLHGQYPEEDWGYFLNEDGSVRWSDVAFTGISHGASTAARIASAVRLYRAVSRSGPRDNGCGNGVATGDYDVNNPPWKTDCNEDSISSWLDETSETPLSRYYALVGMSDGQYGDIMFHMERRGYRGAPVRWDLPGAVLTESNRWYADEGHLDFLLAANVPPNTEQALELAFGVPPENQSPDF